MPGLDKYHGKDIYLTEALTLEINAAISDAVKDDKPFFAYMSHYAVHAPFEADPRFIDNYKNVPKGGGSKLAAFASMIEGMDKSLGDMLDHLEKLGVAEETLVMFLGDNGTDAPIGNQHAISCAAPLRGKKGTHYEGGMRVPFIVAWAKQDPENPAQKKLAITPGVNSNDIGSVCDIMPTVLTATGARAPSGHEMDGASLTGDLDVFINGVEASVTATGRGLSWH